MLIGASSEEEDSEEVVEVKATELRLRPRGIAVYDVASRRYVKSAVLNELTGMMMPLGENKSSALIVGRFRINRLGDKSTGNSLYGFSGSSKVTGIQRSNELSNFPFNTGKSFIWDTMLFADVVCVFGKSDPQKVSGCVADSVWAYVPSDYRHLLKMFNFDRSGANCFPNAFGHVPWLFLGVNQHP